MNESSLIYVDVNDLIPYANNARTHSAEQIKLIQSSLREFGFINPVIIDKDNGIIAGHGRVIAAKKEGFKKVPCVRVPEHILISTTAMKISKRFITICLMRLLKDITISRPEPTAR